VKFNLTKIKKTNWYGSIEEGPISGFTNTTDRNWSEQALLIFASPPGIKPKDFTLFCLTIRRTNGKVGDSLQSGKTVQ
jgi:hypothetical protein